MSKLAEALIRPATPMPKDWIPDRRFIDYQYPEHGGLAQAAVYQLQTNVGENASPGRLTKSNRSRPDASLRYITARSGS